jgi:hypothetical protein
MYPYGRRENVSFAALVLVGRDSLSGSLFYRRRLGAAPQGERELREEPGTVNVRWQLPDGSVREQSVTDVEQMLLILRLAGSVTIEGFAYRVAGSSLVVDGDNWSVAVFLTDSSSASLLNLP